MLTRLQDLTQSLLQPSYTFHFPLFYIISNMILITSILLVSRLKYETIVFIYVSVL